MRFASPIGGIAAIIGVLIILIYAIDIMYGVATFKNWSSSIAIAGQNDLDY